MYQFFLHVSINIRLLFIKQKLFKFDKSKVWVVLAFTIRDLKNQTEEVHLFVIRVKTK